MRKIVYWLYFIKILDDSSGLWGKWNIKVEKQDKEVSTFSFAGALYSFVPKNVKIS